MLLNIGSNICSMVRDGGTDSRLIRRTMFTPNAISLFSNPKHFDNMVQTTLGFDSMFERLFNSNLVEGNQGGYPPYNLKRDGDNYILELAVAGLSEEDIKVNVEDGVLTVESSSEKSDEEFLYQGIARRSFKRSWTLSDDIIVKGASLVDGMLTVTMEKIIPEEKKPKSIPIVTGKDAASFFKKKIS